LIEAEANLWSGRRQLAREFTNSKPVEDRDFFCRLACRTPVDARGSPESELAAFYSAESEVERR